MLQKYFPTIWFCSRIQRLTSGVGQIRVTRFRLPEAGNNIPVKTITDENSKWMAKLSTPAATSEATPYTVTISGSNTIILNNILIGEVWLLSGQSNMDMPMQGYSDAPVEGGSQAISSANFPHIRLITISKNSTAEPQDEIVNSSNLLWKECAPSVVQNIQRRRIFLWPGTS